MLHSHNSTNRDIMVIVFRCEVAGDARWHRIDAPLQNNAVTAGPVLYIYNVSFI